MKNIKYQKVKIATILNFVNKQNQEIINFIIYKNIAIKIKI